MHLIPRTGFSVREAFKDGLDCGFKSLIEKSIRLCEKLRHERHANNLLEKNHKPSKMRTWSWLSFGTRFEFSMWSMSLPGVLSERGEIRLICVELQL